MNMTSEGTLISPIRVKLLEYEYTQRLTAIDCYYAAASMLAIAKWRVLE